jgi:hypothetical protein
MPLGPGGPTCKSRHDESFHHARPLPGRIAEARFDARLSVGCKLVAARSE